jgi:hypothetical protein
MEPDYQNSTAEELEQIKRTESKKKNKGYQLILLDVRRRVVVSAGPAPEAVVPQRVRARRHLVLPGRIPKSTKPESETARG